MPFRILSRALVAVALVAVTAGIAAAQVSQAQAREVLETSNADDVVAQVATQIVTGLGAMGTADTARFAAAVRQHYAAEALLSAMAERIAQTAPADTFTQLRTWLLAEPMLGLQARADSAAKRETLEAFVQRVQADRPPEPRIALAARFATAQDAGMFYFRFLTALQESAFGVARAAGMTVPDMPEPSAADRAQAVAGFGNMAAMSFLQQLEPLSEADATSLIEAWESPSGRWYVAAYTDALVHALEEAGRRAAAAVKPA
jgi:hypothetical protein